MNSPNKVDINVNAKNLVGELKHSWRYIGYDECNYTHTPEGEELIKKFGQLGDAPYYIRAHHMLCTGNCHGTYKWGSTNAYIEDEEGNPIYNWEVIDEILDVYLRNNCKPFFELGFMPMDLVDPRFVGDVNKWDRYGDYKRTGWAAPPKDYDKWKDLIYNLVKHCVEKYGEEEVLSWYWELWNEPDIFYWKGTEDEFCKLYDYTEAAVHLALEGARLGGPATTGPMNGSNSSQFLDKFLKHCSSGKNYLSGEKGTRLDYISFHVKGGGFPFELNAAKETPSVKSLVAQVKEGLEIIKDNGYADCEVVLSEADPDGWAAGGMYDNPNMNFRNTEYYASYVASAYQHIKDIADAMEMDVRPLAWAFLFRGERCFEGTRTFSTQGIDKPIFNLFKIYGQLANQELELQSSQAENVFDFLDRDGKEKEPEVSGIAVVKEEKTIQIFLYSHHDDWDLEKEFD
ncbi:MAG: GH39 family glycosyl hydrolase, partial [Halanaerobiales bacterium]